MQKPGRNDPCLCGSGKKFKKCCESSAVSRGRFKAALANTQSSHPIQKTLRLTSFFQAHLAATPKKPLPPEPPSEEQSTVVLEKNEENLIT